MQRLVIASYLDVRMSCALRLPILWSSPVFILSQMFPLLLGLVTDHSLSFLITMYYP